MKSTMDFAPVPNAENERTGEQRAHLGVAALMALANNESLERLAAMDIPFGVQLATELPNITMNGGRRTKVSGHNENGSTVWDKD